MITNIRKFLEEHIFLKRLLKVSFFLSVVPFLIFVFVFDFEDKIYSFYFFKPLLFVAIVIFLASYFYNKSSAVIKNIAYAIITIIVFIQVFWNMWFSMLCCLQMANKVYDNPKDYTKALSTIGWQERIAHFPQQLPNNALNVEIFKDSQSVFGSEAITLKFTIDSEYIENELKKYKYVDIKNYSSYNSEQPFIESDNGRIKIDGCKLYVINDREHEKLEGHHFPYSYGFCIFKDKNQIIYYYTNPDL